jgi:hypothetical protein
MSRANTCLAIATSADGAFGFDKGDDRAGVAAGAMAQCRSHNGKSCVVQVTPCASDDPRWSSP